MSFPNWYPSEYVVGSALVEVLDRLIYRDPAMIVVDRDAFQRIHTSEHFFVANTTAALSPSSLTSPAHNFGSMHDALDRGGLMTQVKPDLIGWVLVLAGFETREKNLSHPLFFGQWSQRNAHAAATRAILGALDSEATPSDVKFIRETLLGSSDLVELRQNWRTLVDQILPAIARRYTADRKPAEPNSEFEGVPTSDLDDQVKEIGELFRKGLTASQMSTALFRTLDDRRDVIRREIQSRKDAQASARAQHEQTLKDYPLGTMSESKITRILKQAAEHRRQSDALLKQAEQLVAGHREGALSLVSWYDDPKSPTLHWSVARLRVDSSGAMLWETEWSKDGQTVGYNRSDLDFEKLKSVKLLGYLDDDDNFTPAEQG